MAISKILLIQPTIDSIYNRHGWSISSSMQPQGICQLSAFLGMHGYEIKVVDMLVQAFHPEEVHGIIEEFQPDVVGVSTFTPSFGTSLGVCRLAKVVNPEIVTVLGGPHVTLLPEEAINKEPKVDYVIMGEGESPLIELLSFLQYGFPALDSIAGLVYRQRCDKNPAASTIKINPVRPAMKALDILPFVNRDLLPLEMYAAPYSLITSRGCPGECIFCAAGALSGSQQRMRSAEHVFCEVYYVDYQYSPTYLMIPDDTFTVSHRRLHRFCEMMIANGMDLDWWCESRVQQMKRPLLEKMAEAGCASIQFGVESGSQEVLNAIRKHMSLDKLFEVLRNAVELDIHPICSLMIGHFCDTPETMRRTVELAQYLKEEFGAAVIVSVNTLFPGTYQYDHREELGLHLYSEDWKDFDLGNINIYSDNFDRNTLAHFYYEASEHVATQVHELMKMEGKRRRVYSRRPKKFQSKQIAEEVS
jgi:anaerobic magnesium-protoporphyrin IX monomethyl ester cyclase